MEAPFETASLTCRGCGRELETGSPYDDRSAPVPIETGFRDLRNLPEPPRDSPTPWRV